MAPTQAESASEKENRFMAECLKQLDKSRCKVSRHAFTLIGSTIDRIPGRHDCSSQCFGLQQSSLRWKQVQGSPEETWIRAGLLLYWLGELLRTH